MTGRMQPVALVRLTDLDGLRPLSASSLGAPLRPWRFSIRVWTSAPSAGANEPIGKIHLGFAGVFRSPVGEP